MSNINLRLFQRYIAEFAGAEILQYGNRRFFCINHAAFLQKTAFSADKLKQFLSSSEGKMADLNRSIDGKRGGGRRRK